MLIKTEKIKMPFVPNFNLLFSIAISLLIIFRQNDIYYYSFSVIIIAIIGLLNLYYFKKYIQLSEDFYFLQNQKNLTIKQLSEQENKLYILKYFKKKSLLFQNTNINFDNSLKEIRTEIINRLNTGNNKHAFIQYISNELYNINIILPTQDFKIELEKEIPKIQKIWQEKTEQKQITFHLISFIIIFSIGIIESKFYIIYIIYVAFLIARIAVNMKYENWAKNISDMHWNHKKLISEYIYLLQKSAFYHTKLDDFYNFAFHENNFLPETPLLFADIVTLISENFAERKNFLEKYRKLWKNGLKLFFIFPGKIPDEVEKIISEEEKNLAIEIQNIQNKIREWAEFEKKKIAIISVQNKEAFPNLELSNKRKELLIKNFENLAK